MTNVDLYYSMADISEEYLSASEQFSAVAERIRAERNKKIRSGVSAGLILVLCVSAFGIIKKNLTVRLPEISNTSVHGDAPEMTSDSLQTTNAPQTTSNGAAIIPNENTTAPTDKAHGNPPTSEKNAPDTVSSTFLHESPSEKQGDEPAPPKSTDAPVNTTTPPATEPPVPPSADSFLGISLSEWLNRSDVVWGSQDYKGRGIAETIPMGTTKISGQLLSLMDGKSLDTVYAVMVDFSSGINDSEMNHWEYNGNTIAELQEGLNELLNPSEEAQTYIITDSEGNEEIGYLPTASNKEEIAEVKKEIVTIRNAFLENKYRNFKSSFHRQGLEIYAGSDGSVCDNMVFYTFATKPMLESFTCKASEAFVFLPAYDLK